MKSSSKAFQVTYTKAIGGNGTIMVKAPNAESAISNAQYLCHTGSDFRDAVEIDPAQYISPSKQGFAGGNRAN